MAAGIYDEVLWAEVGARLVPLKNTSVTVKNPDGSNATLLSWPSGASAIANPTSSDAVGNLRFVVPDDLPDGVDIVYTPPGQAEKVLRVRPTASGTGFALVEEIALSVKRHAKTTAQRKACGNNVSKPLSGYYATLAAAQADYPHVTALTQELDWAIIQGALNSLRKGEQVFVPWGRYLLGDSTLAILEGRRLIGSGYFCAWDAGFSFGAAVWSDSTVITGTILRFTKAAGIAVDLESGTMHKNGGLSGLAIIGPGSGTSIGLQIGRPTKAVTGALLERVLVGNFSVGNRCDFFESTSIRDLRLWGCQTAQIRANATNELNWYGLNIQKNVDGVVYEDDTCQSNRDWGTTFQSNTGTQCTVRGRGNYLYSPYLENPAGVRGIDFVSGTENALIRPFCAYPAANDTVRVQAAASLTHLEGMPSSPAAVAISNAGTNTVVTGDASALTDTGTGTAIWDNKAKRVVLPSGAWTNYAPALGGGFVLGNGGAFGRFHRIGRTIHFEVNITFGTTSTFGAGPLTVSIPVAAAATNVEVGPQARAFDASTGARVDLWPQLLTSGSVRLYATGANGAQGAAVSSTVPFTWAANAVLWLRGTYQAAA